MGGASVGKTFRASGLGCREILRLITKEQKGELGFLPPIRIIS